MFLHRLRICTPVADVHFPSDLNSEHNRENDSDKMSIRRWVMSVNHKHAQEMYYPTTSEPSGDHCDCIITHQSRMTSKSAWPRHESRPRHRIAFPLSHHPSTVRASLDFHGPRCTMHVAGGRQRDVSHF